MRITKTGRREPEPVHTPSRNYAVDLLKVVASQLIVLHHLAAYGPLSDAMATVAPQLVSWFYDYGRMAVQVFLVIGGYLATRGLARPAVRQIANRYLRLVVPFLVALAFAALTSALARQWLHDAGFVPEASSLGQWLAHVGLLQGPLGFESLTAGAWYVAIDFQLFLLATILMTASGWISRLFGSDLVVRDRLAIVLVSCLALMSVFRFNLDSSMDNWAIYFFGAYAFGMLVRWATEGSSFARAAFAVVVALSVFALLLDFRGRIAVALVTALVIGCTHESMSARRLGQSRLLTFLSGISYSLFLVHFGVYLFVSAIFDRLGFDGDPVVAGFGMLVTWCLSIALATLFHRMIELPVMSFRLDKLKMASAVAVVTVAPVVVIDAPSTASATRTG